MFLLFALWMVLMNQMDVNSPIYKIEHEKDSIRILVSAKKYEGQIKKTMMEEAKKSSLMAMAYIHSLANEHNQCAENIALLYEGYRQFLIDLEPSQLLQRSEVIFNQPNSDEFSKSIALYLIEILTHKTITLSDGQMFMEHLLPSIKETLQMAPITKMHQEQIVKVPEMECLHNAFPDLINFQGIYYVCFREASSHVQYQDFGKIRILRALEKEGKWSFETIALLSIDSLDLRDPRFFIDSNNYLYLIVNGSEIDETDSTKNMIPYIASEKEGKWEIKKANVDPRANGALGQWLWRVTWNDRAGFGFSYNGSRELSLMKTVDGMNYEKVANVSTEKLPANEKLTEATIRFLRDGTAVALIRTDKHGLIGVSKGDYINWSFEVIPFRVGGPNFVVAENDNTMWAATRHFFLNQDNTLDETTILASMTTNKLVPRLRLKGYGDGSYPGLCLEEDHSLVVVYYSSGLDQTSDIYIVRVDLP